MLLLLKFVLWPLIWSRREGPQPQFSFFSLHTLLSTLFLLYKQPGEGGEGAGGRVGRGRRLAALLKYSQQTHQSYRLRSVFQSHTNTHDRTHPMPPKVVHSVSKFSGSEIYLRFDRNQAISFMYRSCLKHIDDFTYAQRSWLLKIQYQIRRKTTEVLVF